MTRISYAVVMFLTGATVALAQTSPPAPTAPAVPPAQTSPSNSAINTTDAPKPAAPVVGANSFTEGQAKSRIENHGYSNVSGLSQDNDGVWRGTAMKDGKSHSVSVDFQGNVIVR